MGAQCSTSAEGRKRMDEQEEELKDRLATIRYKILVMSGKGGVGKSSVAAYLALMLSRRGNRVGLMDVDLHGPSIPHILGITGRMMAGDANRAIPMQYNPKLQVVSMENLLADRDTAVIWRGPLKIGVIKQFITDVEWNPLDYLVIDSPPGTGDEPLTVAQTIPDAQAVIVTTPQEVSLADVRKSINFCRQVNMQVVGLVENMSGLICPHCGKQIDLFRTGGGERTAREMSVSFLGKLPIEPRLVEAGDTGVTTFLSDSSLVFTQEFERIVDKLEEGIKSVSGTNASDSD